jgi:signal peptidase II
MMRTGVPVAASWLILDQATKWCILTVVMDPPRVVPVTNFFNLVLGHNTGVTFGFLGKAPMWSLVAVSLAVIGFLLVWIMRADDRKTAIALGLIVGGALGNLVDRLRHGGVTDFLDFYVGTWHWPAFNVADVGIVCGVSILLLDAIVSNNKRGRGKPDPPDGPGGHGGGFDPSSAARGPR